MKKRIFWFSLSGSALFLGALLYGLCRTDTYIGKLIGDVLSVKIPKETPVYGLLSWYFPDFLWMFSLTCALFCVVLPDRKTAWLLCAVALFWGVLWETIQWFRIVSGTGDVWDIVMYITAVGTAVVINILKRGK